MNVPVSTATEAALRAAMERLLAATPLNTDGRLTVANLAREALISRATANRATAVLIAYREAITARKVKELKPTDGTAERAGDRQAVHIRAQHIQARALLQTQKERQVSCATIRANGRSLPKL